MGFDDAWAVRDCPYCQARKVDMKILVTNANGTSQPAGVWAALERMTYSVLACRVCGGVVTLLHGDRQDGWEDQVVSVFPPDVNEASMVNGLPADVSRHYTESLNLMRAGFPDSVAVALRKTIESAASHFGINDKVLMQRIKKLIEQGHITAIFGDAVHHVRAVGNAGAHAGLEPVSQEAAQRALAFTTQLLRNLFEVPAALSALSQPSGEDDTPANAEEPSSAGGGEGS